MGNFQPVRRAFSSSQPDRTLTWEPININLILFNLSVQELNILPCIYVVVFYMQMKLTQAQQALPAGDDEKARQQQQMMKMMMKFMPIMFFFLFYATPSGLSLYYIASSLVYFVEHRYIKWKYLSEEEDGNAETGAAEPAKPKPSKSPPSTSKSQPPVKAPLPWMSKKMGSGA